MGFSERSSRWFVLTIVYTNQHRQVEKSVKRVHRGLKKKHRKAGELHAYHADEITRKRVLRLLADVEDLWICYLALDKKKIGADWQKRQHYLYNYATGLLLDQLYSKKIIADGSMLTIRIDQRETSKFLQRNFENYLLGKLYDENSKLDIGIKPSYTERSLQAVDFISWAIFRKYERDDCKYYNIVKGKVMGKEIFPL